MILKKYVSAYLERELSDHRSLKKLSRKDLLALIHKRFPDFKPWPKLRMNQLVGCYLGLRYPRFAFYMDMGSGKTLVTLELLRYWYHQGYIRRALVFVISDKAFPTWEKQINQYKIDVPFVSLDAGSSIDKWRLLESFDEGLVLLHYPGTVAMASVRTPKKKGKKKGGLALDVKLIKKLAANVDAIVLDESTRASGESLTGLLCRRLTNPKNVDIVYALAGRPFGRDPTLLWRQQFIVDRGASLGDTLGLFRAAFFSEATNPFGNKWSKVFTFKKRMMPQLTKMTQHRSIIYRSEECVDLPPVNKFVEKLRLPEEAGAYYAKAVKDVLAAKGDLKEMKSAFIRMRQLSSGFLGFKDEHTGERAEVAFDENPKLKRLLDLIQEVPDDRFGVIFYEFTYSGRMIYNAIKELGYKADWLWSGTKDSRRVLGDFTEGRTHFLVLNNKLGAYSLDGLQIANYQFVFESPISPIDREQMERRIERQGQKYKVFRYDLIVQDTADQKILEFHKEGRNLYNVLTASPQDFFPKQKRLG
jgi:hypothetical protein